MWPQIVVLCMLLLGLGIELANHGQPQTDHYNFGIALASAAMLCSLLWAGGFFAPFGW